MIYIIANCVQRRTRAGVQVSHGADEAYGPPNDQRGVHRWAMTELLNLYPESDGWFGHVVQVHELSPDVLRREIESHRR